MERRARFPVFGEAVADQRAWLIPAESFWMAVADCGATGCTITDRLAARVTANPGPEISRIDYNILYSPSTGKFAGSHFEWWSIVHGDISLNEDYPDDGSGLHPNGPSFGSFNTFSINARGGFLAHAFAFWAWIPEWQFWLHGGARTAGLRRVP